MDAIEFVDKKGKKQFAKFLGLVKINDVYHAKVICENRPELIHWEHIMDYCRETLKKEFNLTEMINGKTI